MYHDYFTWVYGWAAQTDALVFWWSETDRIQPVLLPARLWKKD